MLGPTKTVNTMHGRYTVIISDSRFLYIDILVIITLLI